MVSDSVLPSKQALIKICRDKLNIEHSAFKLTGLPCFKDRIIMAIYIYYKLVGDNNMTRKELEHRFGPEVESGLLEKFAVHLGDRASLQSELDQIRSSESNSKKIYTSLEINLMLSILYLAAVNLDIPILEKDILTGAQLNKFKYLTAYKSSNPLATQE